MTTPAPTLYQAISAERAARVGRPTPVAGAESNGSWTAFLAAFDSLLDAFRRNDASRLEHARQDVAELRAQLAAGGVAVPGVSRRVRPEVPVRPLSATLDR